MDSQCPGGAQTPDDQYCVSGACVECRAGMGDCTGTSPICGDTGVCRGCVANSECSSGICESDGHCVDPGQIAYVAPTGANTTDCSKTNPCTLPNGVVSPHPYVVLAAGTYSLFQTLSVTGTKRLVGNDARPTLTSTVPGTIVRLQSEGDLTLEHLKVTGATTNGTAIGYGVECPVSTSGTRTLRFTDTIVMGNASDGVYGKDCTVIATRSEFSNNVGIGLDLQDGAGTIDRCTFTGNGGFYALSLDGGQWAVTNSFITRNLKSGVFQFASAGVASHFEFNTVVDNAMYGVDVQADGNAFVGSNNLVARNHPNLDAGSCAPTACTFPGTITLTDATTAHFVSPDSAPFDYHVGSGSVAIDAAINGSLDHDFDGDVRPKGAGRDVGADEAQ